LNISRAPQEALIWPVALPYSIEVNAFSREEEAKRRLGEIVGQTGFESFTLVSRVSDEVPVYRVFVGKFKDLASALAASEELKKSPLFADDIHVVARSEALGD
jgi:cell division septation protein DedD